MEQIRPTALQVATRGREIYEQQLRSLLEPENSGKFLVIDIETGEYEIDENDMTASSVPFKTGLIASATA